MPVKFLTICLFALCSHFVLFAQKAKKKNELQCQSYGKVRDYSNAIDCGYLIETEEGKLLLPLEIHALDPGYRIGPDQLLKFDFKPMNNTSSLCMVETQSVEITCLQLLPSYSKGCLDVAFPEGGWMMELIEQKKPHTIRKYLRDSDIVYVLESPTEKLMCDCMGNTICSWGKTQKNKCSEFPARSGKLIYQWEKIPD
jgi:hypothetical protein